MAIRLTKENDHVQYGTTNFVADADADITSLPTKVTPGSECFCIETSTTYILNNQGEWKVKSQGGGGGSSSYQEKTITPDFSDGDVSVTADRRYKALSEVTIQKDSNLIAGNIKKDVTVHGITGSYEGGESSDVTKLKSYLARSVTTIDDDILEEVGSYAFANYTNLENASFSEVTTIDNYAFYNSANLTSVSFPEATSIGSFAFSGCNKLTNVSFPKVTAINGDYTFQNTELTNVSFPEITTINGNYTFQSCSKLTSVNFPKVISFGNNTFRNCTSLTSINFPEVTSVHSGTFYGCTGLTSANFPKATSISDTMFANCTELISVNFPEAGSINTSAFSGCTSLRNAIFPKSTGVSNNAFSNCTSLTIADFNSPYQLSANAFSNCSSLTTLILRKSDSIVKLSNKTAFTNTPFVDEVTTATLYVPEALIPSYEANTYWAQILAHEGTTIQKIEGSPYENP